MVEKYNLLLMSTAHIREETFSYLICGTAYPISYGNGEGYGAIVRFTQSDLDEPVTEEWSDAGFPEDLMQCMKFADQNGCEYIRFDSDGPIYDDLKTYSW